MKTRKILIRVISVLVLLCMVATMFACKKDDEGADNTGEAVATKADGATLPFGPENYGKEFNILYYGASMYKNYFFDDVTEAGDVIQSALMERRMMVEDYLGVQVKGVAESSKENSIVDALSRDSMAGIDQYQLALTHSYIGLGTLVSGNYVMDTYELEDITFDEEYWHMDAIEALEIGGKAYFVTSDFMIADVCGVLFNKSMYAENQIKDDPYTLVRNGEWTLEKLMQLSANVVESDPDAGKEGTYGFGARADWEFLPFIDSCEVTWLTGSSYKTLNMGPSNQKYQDVYELIEELADANWSYLYNWGDDDNKITMADGRFLFTLEPLKGINAHLASGVKFGVLPYPKFDTEQKEYHSCDFGGMMCVPTTIQDKAMVGKVLECLAFYSADTVNIAYYERLLGSRVADAPDDAEMLDKYIFGRITLNPAVNYSVKANEPLGILVYTIPKMLRAKLNGTTIDTIATNWAANRVAAQKVIDDTLNK